MPRPPERRVELSGRLNSHLDTARTSAKAALFAAREVVSFLPIAIYFSLYWRRKDRFRIFTRTSALVFLSFSLVLFILEVLMKAGWKHAVHLTTTNYPNAEPFILGGLVLSGLIFLWNSIHETNQKRTQTSLSEALWSLLYSESPPDRPAAVKRWLELVHKAFMHHGSINVCVWQPSSNGMSVHDEHWYPSRDPEFLSHLPPGKGVAGLVQDDRTLRYVPRLRYPFNSKWLRAISLPFYHALEFDVVKNSTGNIDVQGKNASIGAVEFDGKAAPRNLNSFVAVPVTSDTHRQAQRECHGVLCIAFRGTDPLDTLSIKMASVLGLLLASQLDKIPAPARQVDAT